MPDLLDNSNVLYREEAYQIIGAAMAVHRELGAGFLEEVYQEALEIEFRERDIPHQREVLLPISYKGQLLLKQYKADFICFNKIIVELKAVSEINNIHKTQIFNYLKATNYKLGLLINFNVASLSPIRIVL
ncbi:MAG TPA: GxxExxY protein [Marinilabiliaceae bacterium]|nr:GxxExxY protein [Marinilabiliaceae bacterium]